MMLWLLDEHHVLPGAYFRLPAGEKTALRLCFAEIMKERRERAWAT